MTPEEMSDILDEVFAAFFFGNPRIDAEEAHDRLVERGIASRTAQIHVNKWMGVRRDGS